MRRAAITILLLFIISSCNLHKKEDAQQLSNNLAAITDSLNYYGKAWGAEFEIAVKTRYFTHLQPMREGMQDYIENNIISTMSMKDVGDSKQLRQSLLDILHYEKDTILPKLMVFEHFDNTTDEQAITNAYRDMISTSPTDLKKYETMFRYLDEYAEKNDFPKPLNK
jgi:hypothetical protein